MGKVVACCLVEYGRDKENALDRNSYFLVVLASLITQGYIVFSVYSRARGKLGNLVKGAEDSAEQRTKGIWRFTHSPTNMPSSSHALYGSKCHKQRPPLRGGGELSPYEAVLFEKAMAGPQSKLTLFCNPLLHLSMLDDS